MTRILEVHRPVNPRPRRVAGVWGVRGSRPLLGLPPRPRRGSDHVSTDAEKLAQIAALCDAAAFTVADLRAVLAESGSVGPPHDIDEDELFALLYRWDNESINGPGDLAKEILALVRPVGGVTLTAEEAADLAVAASVAAQHLTGDGWAPRFRALAARLEEASS